jgi:uncharacterized membrane protein
VKAQFFANKKEVAQGSVLSIAAFLLYNGYAFNNTSAAYAA